VKKAVIIPAVKKNVAFNDDLVKKLAGHSLIERSVNKAKEITEKKNIYVVTDSEEIRLFSQRKGVQHYFEKSLKLFPGAIVENLTGFLSTIADNYQAFILLSPYVPLIRVEEIEKALYEFESGKEKLLVPVKNKFSRIFTGDRKSAHEILSGGKESAILIESQAFQIIDSDLIRHEKLRPDVQPHIYTLYDDLIEIQSYQDWWVCEKLLKRKRIVFRVIGDKEMGLGHIQRALTLAHEITDHEIRFVCDTKSKGATDMLAGLEYWLGVYKPEEIEDQIIALKPDLVINDILNSSLDYIRKLRSNNISVINFEDLGEGAALANLTINELYDEPLIPGEHILWGREYFFVREEFHDAEPNQFNEMVGSLLIMFGGTDPSDYTRKILHLIKDYCGQKNIKIYVLTGGGYPFMEELKEEIKEITPAKIEYLHSLGVVSDIMEKVQIAISSNGRTAYELAHMNIPSIVLSHHERENTHRFAREENGHIPVGVYKGVETNKRILEVLDHLIVDASFRELLFNRLKPFQFIHNKKKVVDLIHLVLGY